MRLIACIAICLSVAWIGSALTVPSLKSWYASLAKPRWTPPNWLFGPVWTILYVAMAIAAWLVWRQSGFGSRAMKLFMLQLLLNLAWSGVFFYLRAPGSAFVEIVLLWCAILASTIAFGRVAPVAAWLMAPYLIWVSFAAALNFSIWRLNT